MKRVLRRGSVLDRRWRLLEELGSGGHGTVWAAGDRTERGRRAAIKVLREGDHPLLRERFLREARVLTELEHPNVARLLSFGSGDPPYLVMELLPGRTLGKALRERSAAGAGLSLAEVAWVAREIASGVGHAHGHHVVHRDLKPENVMLVEGEVRAVKVLDFGLAKLLDEEGPALTSKSQVLGSLYWISPEQILGGAIGPAADVFALGATIFELLTLRHAWARDDAGEPLAVGGEAACNSGVSVMRRIVNDARPGARALRQTLSPEVDTVLCRAMARAPEERHATPAALVAELTAALATSDEDPDAAPAMASSPRAPQKEAAAETITWASAPDGLLAATRPTAPRR